MQSSHMSKQSKAAEENIGTIMGNYVPRASDPDGFSRSVSINIGGDLPPTEGFDKLVYDLIYEPKSQSADETIKAVLSIEGQVKLAQQGVGPSIMEIESSLRMCDKYDHEFAIRTAALVRQQAEQLTDSAMADAIKAAVDKVLPS